MPLVEELSQAGATAGQGTCRSIEVRTKLSEGSNFTVELEGTGEHLHDLLIQRVISTDGHLRLGR